MGNPFMSVAIPCWGMNGKGAEVLGVSLNKLIQQTFKDFEVVITDHSQDDNIINLCKSWSDILNIKYFRNPNKIGSPTANTNFGIEMSKGEVIKLLCQDDYLFDAQSLQIIAENFTKDVTWLATSYVHSRDRVNYYNQHFPRIPANILTENLIGTPSNVTIRNADHMLFDENLVWAYDCEFYYRMLKKYGSPKIINNITMVNLIWEGQITSSIANQELRNRETEYILRKSQNA